MQSSIYTHDEVKLQINKKRKNVDDLDDTPSDSGSIVKCTVETKHFSRPIYHHGLEFCACWADGPLSVIASGTPVSEDDEVSISVSTNECG